MNLVKWHTIGVTSYGMVTNPARADGYCYLVDASLYNRFPLDESHQWWWSITKQQAEISKIAEIQAYRNHEKWLHHYGGKSGKDYKAAKGMNIEIGEVMTWFSAGARLRELKD